MAHFIANRCHTPESLAGLLGHGRTSARDCSLFERSVFPIPSEAKQSGSAFPIESGSDFAIGIRDPEVAGKAGSARHLPAEGSRVEEALRLEESPVCPSEP